MKDLGQASIHVQTHSTFIGKVNVEMRKMAAALLSTEQLSLTE